MANNPFSAISSLWSSCTTDVIVAIASLIFLKTPSLFPLADLESGCLRQVCNKKLTITRAVERLSAATFKKKKSQMFPHPVDFNETFHVRILYLPLKLSVASLWTSLRLTSLPPFQLLKCHLLNPGSSETSTKQKIRKSVLIAQILQGDSRKVFVQNYCNLVYQKAIGWILCIEICTWLQGLGE